MVTAANGVIKLLRLLSVLLILATLVTLFVYSPFYSKTILWMLNQWVPVNIDPIAAKSQQSGQLSLENQLEPGSEEWVARRAYLYEVNQALKTSNVEQFVDLQIRYQQLLDYIQNNKKERLKINLDKSLQPTKTNQLTATTITAYSQLDDIHLHDEDEPLFQQYREFLRQDEHLIDIQLNPQIEDDFVISDSTPLIFKRPADQPHAIVILGGGLTSGGKQGEIIVNSYTQKRLETAINIYKNNALPILLSGVEAPYMEKWLIQNHVQAQFLENRSMNTCENTRFTSLLLQKQGGAPTVYLVTDAYHMPRSQRLFANNGIATVPINAPLPNPLTAWQPSSGNLMHSRRATYEVLATLRDLWFGESNCREIP